MYARVSRAARLALPLALLFAASAFAQSEAASFRPLLLDGQTSLDVEATPGLDLGAQSTIEFLVATAWEDGVATYPAVLGRREPYDGDDPAGFAAATQYSVHVTPDRKAIGLFDGTRFASVPFDFTDGELHHVALVTKGGRTTVYVDREVRGTLDLGLGTTPGLPLHVGSSDGGSELFVGTIPSLRLWRSPLTAEEVAAIADLLGPPGEGDPDPAKLAAYSDFSGAEPQLVVLEEPEAVATSPLPQRPSRSRAETGADVETRGLGDKLKQKVQSSKQKRIEESIEETEALKRGREGERNRILARLAKYQNAEVTQESVVLGPGQKFRRPKTKVGGQTLSASEERSKRRLEKRLAKLDKYVADYTEKLEGGPPEYAGGAPRRAGLRQQLAEAQAAGAELAAPRPRRQRPLAFVDALPAGEIDTPDGGRYLVRKKLGEGSNGGAYLIEPDGDAAGRPEVLKQALKIDADLLAETNQKRAAGKPRKKPLTQEQAVEARTRREVELQNEAAADDNAFADGAQIVATNRLKMPYAGAALGKIATDIRDDPTLEPEQKVAAFEVMMRKMLEAAASLERRGIVHRDMHDGNMTLDADGNMKLIDFGLAKRAAESDLQLEIDYGVGAGSQYGGRPSPETKDAAADPSIKSTHKSDIYSIGWQLMVTATSTGKNGGSSLLPREIGGPLQSHMQPRMQPGGRPPTRPIEDPRARALVEFLAPFVERDPAMRPSASQALARLPQISSADDLRAAEGLLAQKAGRRIQRTFQGDAAPEPEAASEYTSTGRARSDTGFVDLDELMRAEQRQPPLRRPSADEPESVDLDEMMENEVAPRPPRSQRPREGGEAEVAAAEDAAPAPGVAPAPRPPRRRAVPDALRPAPGRLPRELYRAYIIDPGVEQVIDAGGHTTGKSRGQQAEGKDQALDDSHPLSDQVMQYVVGGPGGRFPRDTDFIGVSSSIDAAVATAWHTGRDALAKPGARIVVYKVNTAGLEDRIVDTEAAATAVLNDKTRKGYGDIPLKSDQMKRLKERWPKGEFTVLGNVGPEDMVMENGRPWKYTIDPKPIAGPGGKLALKELEAYVRDQVREPARQAAREQGAAPAPAQ